MKHAMELNDIGIESTRSEYIQTRSKKMWSKAISNICDCLVDIF